MRSVAYRFLLPVGFFVVLLSGLGLYRTYRTGYTHIYELMDQQAALALEFDLAIRDYVAHAIRPAMQERVAPGEFLPETMSTSFVARSVFEQVHRKFPDYIIKFSSDNPRNPTNRASADELRMIEYFNGNPEVERWSGTIELEGRDYLAHFSAMRMKESCLQCHGRPEDAPASLVQRYGATAGFHRPVGKVIALDTIAVPLDAAHAGLVSEIVRESAVLVAGLALLFVAIVLTFRRVVARRLAVMGAHFERIAAQPESVRIDPIEVRGRDEVSVLAASFNTLAEKVRSAYASLEQRVAARTTALAKANTELEREIVERTEAEEALQRSEERYALAQRAAHIGSWDWDIVTNALHWSDQIEPMFGFGGGEFGRTYQAFLDCVHPQDRQHVIDSVNACVERGRDYAIEHRIVWPDGSVRWVAETGDVIRDENGKALRMLGVVQDVTERKRAQAELEEFAAKLERSNRELEDFASVASHDLLEPLRKVTAFGDRLRDRCGAQLDEQGRDYLERMQNAARRMQTLITDLLTLSRVTTRAQPFAPVDLSQLVQEVLSDLEVRLEELGGQVELRHLPTIDADALQMRQLLQNLIGNALKFRRPEVKPVVRVSAELIGPAQGGLSSACDQTERCRLVIEDNGIGFDERYLDRIFNVFQRLHGRGEYEGTGIGLAVCRKIVERHGGTITAKSRPGEGATFVVTLPLRQASSDETP